MQLEAGPWLARNLTNYPQFCWGWSGREIRELSFGFDLAYSKRSIGDPDLVVGRIYAKGLSNHRVG